jgi:hypothetical protein
MKFIVFFVIDICKSSEFVGEEQEGGNRFEDKVLDTSRFFKNQEESSKKLVSLQVQEQ